MLLAVWRPVSLPGEACAGLLASEAAERVRTACRRSLIMMSVGDCVALSRFLGRVFPEKERRLNYGNYNKTRGPAIKKVVNN